MSRQSVNVGYFFSKLDDPSWIDPLRKQGLLSSPPNLVPDKNGNLRGTHVWPQVDYLKRMAKKDDRVVQEQVLEIMLEVGDANNYFIHRHFAEAALAMPPDLAAKWAVHETQWLHANNPTYSILEDDLGRLVSYLAKNGQVDIALGLAAELLAVFPDPEAEKKRGSENKYSSLEPRIRCEKYRYEQILKNNIPDLAKAAPMQTLELLSELLRKAIVYRLKDPDESQPYDYSTLSRPAIEDHDQNYDFYFQHHLINAVRGIAVDICRKDANKVPEIVKKLENIRWNIFTRIALYILQVVDPVPKALIEERLVNEDMFDDTSLHHEYFHLLKKRFPELSQNGQDQILTWIDAATRKKEYLAKNETDLTEEQKQRRLRYWQYRKLIAIKEHLPADWKERFKKLKQEFHEPEIPADFDSWHGSVKVGSESPKTTDDLAAMSIDELVQYLKEWKSKGEWMGPTPDGLGSALNELVTNAPERFLEYIDLFMDRTIDPTYVKYVIRAFHRVREDKRKLPFEKVFKLCKWVVENPSEMPDRKIPEDLRDGFDMDMDWSNAKHEIARLFEDKVFQDEAGLPFEMKEKAWAIIEPLTEDPDPTLDDEAKYGGGNMDPLTLSINHTRGKALHAVMNYAMWLCRRIKEREDRKATLDDMPEVQTVLEKHLNTDNSVYGMCQTDRAVYGQWLPQIVYVDADWAKDNLGSIFPADPKLKPLRDAAWNTYLLYSRRLGHNVTSLIMDIYREEILTLKGKAIGEDTHKSPETRLAEHVVVLYLSGECGLEHDSLIDLLFRIAPEEICAHTLDFIGRDTNRPEPPERIVLKKMKELWEWRVKQGGGIASMPRKELSTFGWWFAGGHFEDEWAFKWLEEVLKCTGISRSNLFVFERMSEVFADHPAESLRCLSLFMEKNDDPWFFGHKEKGVWSILEQGVQHKDPNIHDQAEDIIQRLGAKGYLEYRELLKRGSQCHLGY